MGVVGDGGSGGVQSSGGVQALGDGYFSIDGKKVNLQDLVMLIGIAMKKTNDENVARKYGEVKAKLDDQQKLNDAMTLVNKYKDDKGKFNDTDLKKYMVDGKEVELTEAQAFDQIYKPVMDRLGVDYSGVGDRDGDGNPKEFSKENIATLASNLDAKLKNMSTQNELDMMDLNKFNSLNTSCMQLLRSGMDEAKQAMTSAAR